MERYVLGAFANCCFRFLESSFAMFSLLHILPNIGNYRYRTFLTLNLKYTVLAHAVQLPIEKDLYFNRLNEGHGLNC
jgi:hypothetical protein